VCIYACVYAAYLKLLKVYLYVFNVYETSALLVADVCVWVQCVCVCVRDYMRLCCENVCAYVCISCLKSLSC
jgi:hypothetical protein